MTVMVKLPLLLVPPVPMIVSSPFSQILSGPQSWIWMHGAGRFGRPTPVTVVEPPSAELMIGPAGVGVGV